MRVNGVDVIPLVEAELNRLHVILEEWDHLRYAVRDLEAIEATS